MAYGKSNGHVTLIGQTRDTYTVRVHYRENSSECYLATIAKYSVLWGSTVGYPSDNLASCLFLCLSSSHVYT